MRDGERVRVRCAMVWWPGIAQASVLGFQLRPDVVRLEQGTRSTGGGTLW